MKCKKCKLDSGKEWQTLCPTSRGGCGYQNNFIEWLFFTGSLRGVVFLGFLGLIFIFILLIFII